MKRRRSKIADDIDEEYKIKKEWESKLKNNEKHNIIILGEHSREPLIIEEGE